jgi:hypothetical protein
MRRREFLEAIAGISALLPGLALGLDPEAFAQNLHARAAAGGALRTLSPPEDAAVTTIADILLPQTDTIGATQVGVNRFIDLLLTEAMLPADRERFLAGLAAIEARSQSDFGAPFGSLRRQQQESLVRALDEHLQLPEEARAQAGAPVSAAGGYALVKRLSLLASFTSEPVAKDLIKAPIIPGRYDGCVPV